MLKSLSWICFGAGFLSILASVGVWFFTKEPDIAHGERFGIFIGLWAPTFLILSERLSTFAKSTTGSFNRSSSKERLKASVVGVS